MAALFQPSFFCIDHPALQYMLEAVVGTRVYIVARRKAAPVLMRSDIGVT